MIRGFKIGDKVKLIAPLEGVIARIIKVGDIGTVAQNSHGICTYVLWTRTQKKYGPYTEKLVHVSIVYAEDHLKAKDVL